MSLNLQQLKIWFHFMFLILSQRRSCLFVKKMNIHACKVEGLQLVQEKNTSHTARINEKL